MRATLWPACTTQRRLGGLRWTEGANGEAPCSIRSRDTRHSHFVTLGSRRDLMPSYALSRQPGAIDIISDSHDPSDHSEQEPPTVEGLDGIQPPRGVDGVDKPIAVLYGHVLELDCESIVLHPDDAGRQSAHAVENHVQQRPNRQCG